jgi:hypothetical protein
MPAPREYQQEFRERGGHWFNNARLHSSIGYHHPSSTRPSTAVGDHTPESNRCRENKLSNQAGAGQSSPATVGDTRCPSPITSAATSHIEQNRPQRLLKDGRLVPS